jgi:hypothetical protein
MFGKKVSVLAKAKEKGKGFGKTVSAMAKAMPKKGKAVKMGSSIGNKLRTGMARKMGRVRGLMGKRGR